MSIEELYYKLITSESSLCYPFLYDDKNLDFLDSVHELITLFMKEVNHLDAKSILTLNHVFDDLPESYKPKKNFDFIRDVKAVANLTISVLEDSFRSYHEDAYSKIKHFF